MKPNNFAMRDWHLEHVEKVILRYMKGLSPDASSFEKRNFKKYSTLSSCAKQIEYDMKHGVTYEEVYAVMNKIRNDDSYSEIRRILEAVQRLDELERQLVSPKRVSSW
jgi:hypothetical protein